MHAKSFDGIRNFRHNTECGAVAACAGERRNKPLCGKIIVNVLSCSACHAGQYNNPRERYRDFVLRILEPRQPCERNAPFVLEENRRVCVLLLAADS